VKRKPDALLVLALCFAVGAIVTLAAPFITNDTQANESDKTLQAGVYPQ
jgi:hypothetical protein